MADRPALPPRLADRLGFLLAQAHGGLRLRGEAILSGLGLDVKQYAVLTALRGLGSAPSQQELATRLRMDRTTMVAILDALEQGGLVRRARDPGDRRRHAVEVTAKGKRVHRRADELVDEAEAAFVEPLSEPEARELHRMLRVLAEAGGAAPRAIPRPASRARPPERRRAGRKTSRST